MTCAGISIKDGGTLEGTANSVTGLNFTTGLNVTRAKGSNEVSIAGAESGISNTPRRVTELPAEASSLDRETVYLTADYTKSTGINITPQLFAGTELDSVTNPDAPSGIGTQGWYRKSDAGFTFGEINPDLPSDFILISDKRIYVADDTQTNLAKIFLGTTEYTLTRVDQTNTKLFSSPGPAGPNNPLVDYYTIGGTGLPASGDWDDLRFETVGVTQGIVRDSAKDITTNRRGKLTISGTTLWVERGTGQRSGQLLAYNTSTRARDSNKDISISSGDVQAIISDSTTLWWYDSQAYQFREPNTFGAYNTTTLARDSSKDIIISRTGNYTCGTLYENTIFMTDGSTAYAFNKSDGSRDSSKDISIGSGSWTDCTNDGTTLWFIDNTSNYARAYVASTRARDSGKDINLGSGGWYGVANNGTNLWFSFYEFDSETTTSTYALRAYTLPSTLPPETIPPLINIPKGNYENRNTDWAKSEFDAPEVQSDKDFKIAVEEQRPGTRQDQNLAFVASGSTFTTTNPFPGIIRITYNNLSTDTDTYQRYTVFVPLDGFEDSKAPHLLKIGSVNYALSYLETETNQAVYRSSVVKSTERIASASTISAMNVQALDNSWFGETGGGKFLKTINKHDLSTFTNSIQGVHALPGSPHEGREYNY